MDDQKPIQICIFVNERYSDTLLDSYVNDNTISDINLDVRKYKAGMYASLEWAIPTMIGLYFIKPYLDGFIKELAKDHYTGLKNWIKKIANDAKKIKITTVSSDGSIHKLEENNQSRAFSISTVTNDDHELKFLFDDNLSIEQWNTCIDKIITLLDEHFTNGKDDQLTLEIKKDNLESSIYGKINTSTLEWEFLDIKKVIQNKMEQQQNRKE
ncbi:hypothetical protein [Xanthocytophaga agilis]|uniref:Uncharacterized protein n=1 Tax=Xanthocytophaga agilis TaxID=3048010 RepID=A0AAE3R8M2_9BACT|nr:hypothetical protein [Xanthocytophaga agilis]MDJ1503592.1 hypothetical protein [Xanthocytophaga agilis]